MSVTEPAGFRSGAVSCGLKSDAELDLTLIINDGPLNSGAAVFTTNRSVANPIIWSRQVMEGGEVSAILINSGGANCYTGAQGFQTTHASAERVSQLAGVSAGEVLVCSTGLIGEQLNRDKLLLGINGAFDALSPTGGAASARAIMTTDSVPKLSVARGPGYTLGGMAKGAGMLAPSLATMLSVITTDADVDSKNLNTALQIAVNKSFNRLDSDGCTSTNDQVSLLASGASAVKPDLDEFQELLDAVCMDLAMQLMADAEGASHEVHIRVLGATTEDEAVVVARSVARNNLFKAAVYGNDPNWGRIYAAIGTTSASFDPMSVRVTINGVCVADNGEADQPRELVDMTPRKVLVEIDLKAGELEATVFTNDLTHDYVTENSAYSS